MNRFKLLNKEELALVEEAGYIVEEDREYNEEDYKKCESVIGEYIMSHSKNEIPKIEKMFSNIIQKLVN